MSDETDEMRARARALATSLAEHLRMMNAAALMVDVIIEDEKYIVSVEREDVTP